MRIFTFFREEPFPAFFPIGSGTSTAICRYLALISTQSRNVYNTDMQLIERPLPLEADGSHSVSHSCPICGSRISGTLHDPKLARIYLVCDTCSYIFLHPDHHLPPDAQKRRYLQHCNGLQEKGYITFLTSFLQTAVLPHIAQGAHVLDYGSGPVPAFSWMLHTSGYRVDSFDPFFFPDMSWEKKTYDAVLMIEVLEHLAHPVSTINRLRDQITPGGYLCIRSNLHHDDVSHFASWWYRQDPTHVSFFSVTTIGYLATALGMRTVSIADHRDIILHRPAESS